MSNVHLYLLLLILQILLCICVSVRKLDLSDTRKTNTQLLSNEFNNFFTNVGPDLAGEINQDTLLSVSSYLFDCDIKTMLLIPVDKNQLL